MYVKNNNFYFDKNDYLNFNNLKFTVHGSSTRRIVNRDFRDYAMDIMSLQVDYGIYICFYNADKSDKKLKLLITKDKRKNKMSLLCNLKAVVTSTYNALLLCKQYVNVFKYNDKLNILIRLINKKYGKSVNLIELYAGQMDLTIDIDNPITQNNTITVIMQSNTDKIPPNKIIIKNNVIYTNHKIIMYPESYNIYYDNTTSHLITFCHNDNDAFIMKGSKEYYVCYYTPPPLLTKFIDNIKLFDNARNIHINNEYDILKYL